MIIERNNYGDILIEESLEKMKEELLKIKASEINSASIIEAIHHLLNTHSILPKNALIAKTLERVEVTTEDYNKTLKKVIICIDSEVKQGNLKVKKGKAGGFYK